MTKGNPPKKQKNVIHERSFRVCAQKDISVLVSQTKRFLSSSNNRQEIDDGQTQQLGIIHFIKIFELFLVFSWAWWENTRKNRKRITQKGS